MSLVTTRAHGPAAQQQAPPLESEPLFRPEVMAQRQNQWLGTVLLEPRISATMFVTAAALSAAAVIALLFFGSFTRKARINGWLVPEHAARCPLSRSAERRARCHTGADHPPTARTP
jgi:membrane fusion protein